MDSKIMCYTALWNMYRPDEWKLKIENMDTTLFTHLVIANAIIEKEELKFIDSNYYDAIAGYIQLKKDKPDLKVLITVGGWSNEKIFHGIAEGDKLEKFCQNAVKFLQEHKFDGMDISWFYPKAAERKQYVKLLESLKAKFPREYILTAAVRSHPASRDDGYDVPEICKYVDFLNVLTYDMRTHEDHKIGPHNALHNAGQDDTHSIESSLNEWTAKGAPKEKILVGLGTHSRTFQLSVPGQHQLHAPCNNPGKPGIITKNNGTLAYFELMNFGDWDFEFDRERCAAYAYNDDQWVSYESMESIEIKAKWIKENQFAGASVWILEDDDFKDDFPLLTTLNCYLRNH